LGWLDDALRRFRGADSKGGWPQAVGKMVGPLADARSVWFDGLILAFDRESRSGGVPKPLGLSLEGDGEAALIGFQLYLVLGKVAEHQYIPRDRGTEFADALFPSVCGRAGDGPRHYFVRYWDAQNDRAVLLLRFGLDMAKHIAGKVADSTMAPAFVGAAIPMLSDLTQIAVADAFGDTGTVRAAELRLRQRTRK
jgi:hypothetical protein